MILKSLELQGFKTFPDKTTLSFEEGITSVVGPNGSGKSNISDAMRWVLGEQSVRVLRCSKMEDVVFNGTPKRKAQGYAEVTLNIDNSDRRLDFDNDNVAVTRRYYRSGESEYLINKTLVRLKDVNEMFMDTGLGRDGYSIIGQGKIDSIVGAKSEDRREIFEEASGISRYRYKKEESERRLNRAEDNLIRLRDILAELEERVEPLRIQAEKAEKFIAFDAEKKELEIGLWVETLARSGRVLRENSEKIEIAKSQQDQITDDIEEISQKIEESFRETNARTVQMDESRNEAAKLDEQAVRAEGEISVFENDISHNEQNIQRIETQIKTEAYTEKNIEQDIKAKKAEILLKDKNIEDNRKKLDTYNKKLEELRQGTDEITKQMEETTLKLAELNADVSEERISLTSAQSSMNEIDLRAGAVEDSIAQNEVRLQELLSEGKELADMLSDIEESISAMENSVRGYEMRLESRRQKAESAKKEADSLRLDASEQERRAKILSDLERNLEGFAQSVKAVMKESGRGLLRGIYGPVTKIIKTPKEYAVALEIALGGAMQNIVVESESDAKAAIGFLKKNNVGRATFLPRTTIKGRVIDVTEMEEMPGFVGVASELCSCEERFSGIKESLLGRVAVAEDLDSAVSIAKRTGYRFRIVSLDGQVVNAGGSLTGGSQVRNSGLLSRTSEIERITERAAELRTKADAAEQIYKNKVNEASSCLAELEACKGELSSLQEERIKVLSEYARVNKETGNCEQEAEALLLEKTNAGERLAQLKAIEICSAKRIEQLTAETDKLNAAAKEMTGNREDRLAHCEEITQTVQEIRLNEYAAQKDRDTLRQSVIELETRKNSTGDIVSKLREEIEALTRKNGELKEAVSAQKDKVQKLRQMAEAERAKVTEIANERMELEKSAGLLRQKEREITARRENIGQELARLQERMEHSQREYDGIITKLWEEYELTRKEAEEQSKPIEDVGKAQRRLSELKNKIKALGAVNVAAVVEYKEVSERYEFLNVQIADIEKSKLELLKLIGELTKQMREQFIERFAEINRNFGSIFKELFGGGTAELSFSDETDVLTSGIEIKVHPPGKIVTHIESLSGGEKALVAISIYFAIMRVSPPPFCVLDEIEAALDDVNVARFAQYLGRMSKNTQFITITHRRGTMEGSDMLYGVTMQDQGISKLLALKTEAEAEDLQAIS